MNIIKKSGLPIEFHNAFEFLDTVGKTELKTSYIGFCMANTTNEFSAHPLGLQQKKEIASLHDFLLSNNIDIVFLEKNA